MAGMLLSGTKIFTSIGIGAMLVVFFAMVGSLTVLPAVLGKLGDRVERGIVAEGAAAVLRALRPLGRQPSALLRLRDRQTWLRRAKGDRPESRFTDLPRSIPIVKTYIAIQKEFPGAQTPAQVVVQAPDVTAPACGQRSPRSSGRRSRPAGCSSRSRSS